MRTMGPNEVFLFVFLFTSNGLEMGRGVVDQPSCQKQADRLKAGGIAAFCASEFDLGFAELSIEPEFEPEPEQAPQPSNLAETAAVLE